MKTSRRVFIGRGPMTRAALTSLLFVPLTCLAQPQGEQEIQRALIEREQHSAEFAGRAPYGPLAAPPGRARMPALTPKPLLGGPYDSSPR